MSESIRYSIGHRCHCQTLSLTSEIFYSVVKTPGATRQHATFPLRHPGQQMCSCPWSPRPRAADQRPSDSDSHRPAEPSQSLAECSKGTALERAATGSREGIGSTMAAAAHSEAEQSVS